VLFRSFIDIFKKMSFTLPDLPYGYDSLAPYVDSMTMNVHHTKHHATYISNLNKALSEKDGDNFKTLSLTELQKQVVALPDSIRTTVRNNGGGHYNHEFFWKVMAPPGSSASSPSGELKRMIDDTFGDTQQMKEKFNKAATDRFGSGWAWLCLDKNSKLFISSTPNQDNPLMETIVDKNGIPVLGLDVWEHAYYLQYQNKRADYINAFWNVVNWDQVVKNFDEAKKCCINS